MLNVRGDEEWGEGGQKFLFSVRYYLGILIGKITLGVLGFGESNSNTLLTELAGWRWLYSPVHYAKDYVTNGR